VRDQLFLTFAGQPLLSSEIRVARLLPIARLQFAILLLTPFHFALLPTAILLETFLLALLLLLARTVLLNTTLLTLLLLLVRSILLNALLLSPILFLALLLLTEALLLCLSKLALLMLAVPFLAIANSLFSALLLRLLLPGPLIFGLGVAAGLGLPYALGLVLAPFLPFTLLPALRINRG
jgi:hypothetical protein